MDERERLALEHEVQEHLACVELLAAEVKGIEEAIEQDPGVASRMVARLRELRVELRGRMAAIAMGEARLCVDPM
jgi:hypothetical protein